MKLLSGTFYRLIDMARAGDVLAPAKAPEGRFHHDGQQAIYLSETPEGTRVAMAYYARAGDPEQTLFTLHLTGAMVVDATDFDHCAQLGIDPSPARIRWQKERTAGRVASTWALSDAARALGADGMLYPSSTRPDLTHLVLWRWNQTDAPQLKIAR